MAENKTQEIPINNNQRITWEGCSVLLDINDGERMVFERLTPAASLKIGNKKCSLQPLIGSPFGSLFELENGENGPFLSRVSTVSEGNNNDSTKEEEESPTVQESKDNRELIDNNTSQSLTGEDIEEMRRKGAKGAEIIEALISNSATFDKKTAFSQEKYRLKKQKKYSPRVLLRRPVTRSICEAYFKKRPEQIGFLRMDTLALLLSLANVTSHSDVLVVDMVGGLVTGAIAERLGGKGYVCNAYHGSTPYSVDIVRMFNFGKEICERIVSCSLKELCSTSNVPSASIDQLEDACNSASQSNDENTTSFTEAGMVSFEGGNSRTNPETVDSQIPKLNKCTKAGQKAPPEAVNSWKENGFSSLIVAAPLIDAWSTVKEVLPLLAFSAPFAVYHQYQQPLAQCMHNLQVEKMAIGLQVSELWLREYQVLPSRTHPQMQMSTAGGYVLSGTRIHSDKQDVMKQDVMAG
ncbi:OLC1v1018212C1 [Oldenlandia corymbosa var. corymbosa]|uniref:tRNA (adenine(58)-N(1))-methyltransferase non-catalytic subunit TRM6 n=1 Tax=Oldenlandia corymbosa var. corymbosa TaxID=529605 RepID=A0AAV1EBA3_OLDCO|nr:OLC1v1018212C1 [Oldenlandia corymbosa var. corymbosa]